MDGEKLAQALAEWEGIPKPERRKMSRMRHKRAPNKDVAKMPAQDAKAHKTWAEQTWKGRDWRPNGETAFEYLTRNRTFDGDECLFMPNSRPHVRHMISYFGERRPAAAFMCQFAHGGRPDGNVVRHKCGNGHLNCVNPKHLVWGTPDDNRNDHRLHTAASLDDVTPEQAVEITASTKPAKVLAVEMQITAFTIDTIRRAV